MARCPATPKDERSEGPHRCSNGPGEPDHGAQGGQRRRGHLTGHTRQRLLGGLGQVLLQRQCSDAQFSLRTSPASEFVSFTDGDEGSTNHTVAPLPSAG
jgi:hypothetical protein